MEVLNTKRKVLKKMILLHQLLQARGKILNNHNSHISYSPWISALLCPRLLWMRHEASLPCGGNTQGPDQRTLRGQVPPCDTAEIIGWLCSSRYLCQLVENCAADGRLRHWKDLSHDRLLWKKGFNLQAWWNYRRTTCTSLIKSCFALHPPAKCLIQPLDNNSKSSLAKLFFIFLPEWARKSIGHKSSSLSFPTFKILWVSESIIVSDQCGHSSGTCPPEPPNVTWNPPMIDSTVSLMTRLSL